MKICETASVWAPEHLRTVRKLDAKQRKSGQQIVYSFSTTYIYACYVVDDLNRPEQKRIQSAWLQLHHQDGTPWRPSFRWSNKPGSQQTVTPTRRSGPRESDARGNSEKARNKIQLCSRALQIKRNHGPWPLLSEMEFAWTEGASGPFRSTNIQCDGGNLYITRGVCSEVYANWVSVSSSPSLRLTGHSWHTL